MDVLQHFFQSGRIADAVLALLFFEAAALALLDRLTGRGPGLAALLATLASGAFLVLALRSALIGAPWFQIASFLAAALIAHLADVTSRWRHR